MNLLDVGASWLAEKMEAHASSPVTYVRGSDTCITNASFAKTQFAITDQDGMLHDIDSHDFIVRTENLLFGTTPFLPIEGDLVIVPKGPNVQERYVVSRYGHAQDSTGQPYRPCDSYGYQIRIHTRRDK